MGGTPGSWKPHHSMLRDLSNILEHTGILEGQPRVTTKFDFWNTNEENDLDTEWMKWRRTGEFLDSAGVIALEMVRAAGEGEDPGRGEEEKGKGVRRRKGRGRERKGKRCTV